MYWLALTLILIFWGNHIRYEFSENGQSQENRKYTGSHFDTNCNIYSENGSRTEKTERLGFLDKIHKKVSTGIT